MAAPATPDLYHHAFLQGGAIREGLVVNWLESQGSSAFYDEVRQHRLEGAWWDPVEVLAHAGSVRAAGLYIGGWYDLFNQGTLDGLSTFQERGGSGAAGRQYLVMGPWTHTYLHANYVTDDTNNYNLDGVAGDAITDGLDLHIQGGDGANNQEYPDAIARYDSDATTILSYRSSSYKGAIRVTDSDSGARIVYLGFGYEAINNPQDRADLLGAALEWMGVNELFVDGFDSGDTSRWSLTVP